MEDPRAREASRGHNRAWEAARREFVDALSEPREALCSRCFFRYWIVSRRQIVGITASYAVSESSWITHAFSAS